MSEAFMEGFLLKCAEEGVPQGSVMTLLRQLRGPALAAAGGGALGAVGGAGAGAIRSFMRPERDEMGDDVRKARLLDDILAGVGYGGMGGAGVGLGANAYRSLVDMPEVRRVIDSLVEGRL
jgi:hypothetical protein